MIKSLTKKYIGVLFFYLAIVGMILCVNEGFKNMESKNNQVAYSYNE